MRAALEILLQSGEGQYVEFKSCFDRLRNKPLKPRALKTVARDLAICLAELANADGGTLLLGVENDGSITGCPFNAGQIESIRGMAGDSWKKAVPYSFETSPFSGFQILIFEVNPQLDVYALTDGRTPYRNNDQTVWFTHEEVRELKRTKSSTLVEKTATQYSLSDLDLSLLKRFRDKIGGSASLSDEDLLLQHDLAVRDGSGTKLTLAACLLFGKPPMARFHERCGINFRRFDGTVALTGPRNNEIKDETIEACLPVLVEQIFQLVHSQIGVSTKLRDLFFEERPEYPTFAWQETIINAVAHRDYSLRGNEIEIQMFDDRLEVKNPGLPPEPVTIEDLQQRKPVHASRNPRIMRVLKVLGLVRERGEGLPRVFEETEQSFLPAPDLFAEGRFFKIVLRNTPVFDEDTMKWLRVFPIGKMNVRQRRILACSHQSGKGFFTLGDYVRQNKIDRQAAKKEIREMIELQTVEIVGKKKGAKYYPLLQRGTIEERLMEYFSRHEFLTNREYRRLAGGIHIVTASIQLRSLVKEGMLIRKGSGKGSKYYATDKLLKTK